MFKLSHNIFLSVILLILFGSSVHSSQDPGSVCILSNAPQQCGAFCLSALLPLFDRMELLERHLREMLIKVDSLDKSLQGIDPMDCDGRLRGPKDYHSALESKLLNELALVKEMVSRIDKKTPPSGFVRIGSRYFYIEETQLQTWTTASLTCRKMGGQLASIKNQEELNEISARLKAETYYWLGIYEPLERGKFRSLASNKSNPFTNWRPTDPTEPMYEDESLHCVLLRSGFMHVSPCDIRSNRFICQADEEI